MDQPWRVRTKLIQGPPGPNNRISGQASWTPGTISGSGASASTTVPVAGAALGQTVLAAFSLALPAGVLASYSVTTAGVVTFTLTNFSGSPVTFGAGTVWADVLVH